jgi:hypothetical protein
LVLPRKKTLQFHLAIDDKNRADDILHLCDSPSWGYPPFVCDEMKFKSRAASGIQTGLSPLICI